MYNLSLEKTPIDFRVKRSEVDQLHSDSTYISLITRGRSLLIWGQKDVNNQGTGQCSLHQPTKLFNSYLD